MNFRYLQERKMDVSNFSEIITNKKKTNKKWVQIIAKVNFVKKLHRSKKEVE
jgi:hypothetical protein